jgi:hypothetical protein
MGIKKIRVGERAERILATAFIILLNRLGHENCKTREKYTPVSNKGFDHIISPLDSWDIKF